MIKSISERKKCIKCGRGAKDHFNFPCLIFNWLEGDPVICDKCMFETITGLSSEWKKIVKDYLC